jgi:hypothetical protein
MKAEIDGLRAEVSALRTELGQAVGAPPAKEAEPEAPDPNLTERQRLETQLADEKAKLAAIQKAVDGGLERAAVADSIERAEARIKELEAAIARLAPPPRPLPPPDTRPMSLHEASAALKRIEARLAATSTPTVAATPMPAATPQALTPAPAKAGDASEETKALALLPLEFTAFGDFFYQFSRLDEDGFYIGAIELDAALKLSDWVNVATAIAFNGADDEFGLGAFVIDCGIFGQGEGYPIQTKVVEKSGVSFGKFDVPFGAAYLEYPAVSNRLVTLPQSVLATHGGWNDVGAQAYALAEHWTGTAYLVNGPAYPTESGEDEPARSAAGGRLSAKLAGAELGGSGAWVFGVDGTAELFAGADLSGAFGPLDLRAEYLLKRVDVEGPDDTPWHLRPRDRQARSGVPRGPLRYRPCRLDPHRPSLHRGRRRRSLPARRSTRSVRAERRLGRPPGPLATGRRQHVPADGSASLSSGRELEAHPKLHVPPNTAH